MLYCWSLSIYSMSLLSMRQATIQDAHIIHILVQLYLPILCVYVGEFGIVYKAHLVKLGQSIPEVIAVKTLKG